SSPRRRWRAGPVLAAAASRAPGSHRTGAGPRSPSYAGLPTRASPARAAAEPYGCPSTPAPARRTPPAATASAPPRTQNTAGYDPSPTHRSEAPTGPTARAPLAPSATAPAITP